MSIGVTKDYKLKLRKLRASHTLGSYNKVEPPLKIKLVGLFAAE